MLLAFALGLVLASRWCGPWPGEYLVLASVALLLMLLGIADDLWDLSVRLRFSLYTLCSLVAVVSLVPVGDPGLAPAVLPVVVLIVLWSMNLYNFMDGIDGLAAGQCLLACSAGALLSWQGDAQGSYPVFCLLLAASHGGFLLWNWPPARLFMGDAGSIPTGFLLAGLALLGAVQEALSPACWLVLLALFITDASWTLVWRMATGQKFTRPHRMHAYQRLSARWNSHLRVDLLLLAIFLIWLLPLAWMIQIYPRYTFLLVILAYLPLLYCMAKIRVLP
jgi:Fuc2NAc and GlcNAc transferase